jgi:hypothetical protein
VDVVPTVEAGEMDIGLEPLEMEPMSDGAMEVDADHPPDLGQSSPPGYKSDAAQKYDGGQRQPNGLQVNACLLVFMQSSQEATMVQCHGHKESFCCDRIYSHVKACIIYAFMLFAQSYSDSGQAERYTDSNTQDTRSLTANQAADAPKAAKAAFPAIPKPEAVAAAGWQEMYEAEEGASTLRFS